MLRRVASLLFRQSRKNPLHVTRWIAKRSPPPPVPAEDDDLDVVLVLEVLAD